MSQNLGKQNTEHAVKNNGVKKKKNVVLSLGSKEGTNRALDEGLEDKQSSARIWRRSEVINVKREIISMRKVALFNYQ